MTEVFIRVHLFLARHRGVVLLLAGVFAVCAVLLGRSLKLNEDFTDMLPMSDPAIAEQVEALKHVRQADRLFVDVQTTAPDPSRLAEAVDLTDAALRAIPELGDFRCHIDAADLRDVYEELQTQLPSLLASNELHELELRLKPAALEQRLAWLKKTMSQPQGLMFKDVAQTDPAGISDTVSARLRALQAGIGDARIVNGWITSADGLHVLLSAAPAFRSSEVGKCAALMKTVLKAARSVESRFPDGFVRIAITGAHRSALDNATLIREDSTLTSVLAAIAVALLMLAAYRRRWLALLGLLPTVFGALGALVIFHLTGDPVSAVALGCGSILIGVTVDYGIYVLYHTDDAPPGSREQLARAVATLVPALTFGALTTMAAFLVMFISPVSGHRQLGLFGATGVALAAVFAMVILPLFIPVNPGGLGRVLPLTTVMQRLFDWRARHARLVLPLLLLFTGVCVLGVWRLGFDGDFARLNGVTAETRRDEELVREVWGKALSLTTVVVSGADREEALQKNERVYAALRALHEPGRADLPVGLDARQRVPTEFMGREQVRMEHGPLQEQQVVETFSSIAPLLPSDRTRQANRRDWQAFWSDSRRLDLGHSLAGAGANLGFRADAFQPFLDRIASPALAATGMDSALGRLATDYWSEKDGRVFICTLVKVKDRESFKQLREAIQREVPDAMLLNKAALADEITRIARRALPLFGVMVAVLNAVLLYLLLGRLELVLITLLPMAAGVFWTLGSLGLLGLPIDMSNFIFVIFVIGVGGDYSLFMVLAELEPLRGYKERTASTGGAVTLCALTTLFGVGVLVLARHPALFSVGLTALMGISFSLLATLFLVPPCMRCLRSAPAPGAVFRALAENSGDGPSVGIPSLTTCANQAGRGARPATPEAGVLPNKEVASPPGAQPACLRARRKQVSRLYRYQGPYVTQFVYWKMRTDPLFQAVEKATPLRGRILDLGCGYGILAHWLTLFAPERSVSGVDFDADKIRVAQATARANPGVAFEQRDILEWTEYPACDCVLLCDVLHYFPRELKAEVLRKVFQALRPGGCLIVRDACAEGTSRHGRVAWSEKWAVRFGQNKTRHGLHFESEESHLALLREAGFAEATVQRGAGLGSNVLLIAAKD
jgi:predicted exporter/SAM-dependent methyltransferase